MQSTSEIRSFFRLLMYLLQSEQGAFHADKKDRGAGGLGGKMIPSAVLVIQNGTTRLVNIKNQDTMTKILDMVPDVIDRFKSPSEDKMTEEDVADLLNEADSPENQE